MDDIEEIIDELVDELDPTKIERTASRLGITVDEVLSRLVEETKARLV